MILTGSVCGVRRFDAAFVARFRGFERAKETKAASKRRTPNSEGVSSHAGIAFDMLDCHPGGRGGRPAERADFVARYAPLVRAYLGARWRDSPCAGELEDAVQE